MLYELARDLYHVAKVPHLTEPEFEVIRPYLDPQRDSVDVGANIGVFTNFLARRSRSVVAIEAAKQNFRALCWMVGTYGLNVTLINAAASDHEGELRFKLGNSLYECHVSSNGHHDFVIRSIPLDSLNLSPSFIKIDVEGHESEVLRGARGTILRCHPALLVEVNHKQTEGIIADFGYRVEWTNSVNKLFVY